MAETVLLSVTLNARLRPLDRGELYEDTLDGLLQRSEAGVVSGGGTILSAQGEPLKADLDIELTDASSDTVEKILAVLERLGAPKGSSARVGDAEPIAFGATEGVGIYLNGTGLPADVYRDNDVNELIADLDAAVADDGRMQSYWEGPTETALYYYGASAATMKERMAPVLAGAPLAHGCRVVNLT